MKLLVIGCNGQLGTDMVRIAGELGHTVTGIDYPAIDISSEESTRRAVAAQAVDEIINCSAYTAVDDCEQNRETAFRINADGPSIVARCALERGATVVHVSTDYVFDGTAREPYVESDTPNPLTVYGQSKLAGERRLLETAPRSRIFRIAWLYGAHGTNFVKAIRSAAQKKLATGEPLRVVDDQFGTPTWTVDVCRQVLKLAGTAHTGIFHSTSEGACTWFEFATEIVKAAGLGTRVLPCTTAEFPRPAPRPAWSVLENARLKELGLNIMRDWKEGFREFQTEEKGAQAPSTYPAEPEPNKS